MPRRRAADWVDTHQGEIDKGSFELAVELDTVGNLCAPNPVQRYPKNDSDKFLRHPAWRWALAQIRPDRPMFYRLGGACYRALQSIMGKVLQNSGINLGKFALVTPYEVCTWINRWQINSGLESLGSLGCLPTNPARDKQKEVMFIMPKS